MKKALIIVGVVLGVLATIIAVCSICYLCVPDFSTWVDKVFNIVKDTTTEETAQRFLNLVKGRL